MQLNKETIGIVSTGMYIPDTFMTGEEIAAASGLPKDVVESKMGILRKPVPGDGDHTCEMGIKAAREAINKANVDPREIDLVIYIGEEHKEYPLWTAGSSFNRKSEQSTHGRLMLRYAVARRLWH